VINQFKDNFGENNKTIKQCNKKSISEKSNSSTDKSIISESDSDSDNENIPKDNMLSGKCLIPIKNKNKL